MKTKKTLQSVALVVFLCLAQFTFSQDMGYSETVALNPTYEEDIKVVTNYVDAITNNKMDVVSSLLADDYQGTGPSNGDISTKTEVITSWTESHKKRTNQKNEYVYNTFRVLNGDLKGDWVSIWGTYMFTEQGKDITLPYQFTAEVKNSKIQRSVIYYDNLAVVQAMGYEITPPKTK